MSTTLHPEQEMSEQKMPRAVAINKPFVDREIEKRSIEIALEMARKKRAKIASQEK